MQIVGLRYLQDLQFDAAYFDDVFDHLTEAGHEDGTLVWTHRIKIPKKIRKSSVLNLAGRTMTWTSKRSWTPG